MSVQKNGREIFNDSDINNPDIDGGTVDNATIGGTTPAAGTFTTLAGTTVAGEMISTDDETVAGTATDHLVTPANIRAVISDDMADATLSGAPVIFSIKDKDGNAYYFKAYPTKTP